MSSLSCDYYMNDAQDQSILRQNDVTIAISDLRARRGTASISRIHVNERNNVLSRIFFLSIHATMVSQTLS